MWRFWHSLARLRREIGPDYRIWPFALFLALSWLGFSSIHLHDEFLISLYVLAGSAGVSVFFARLKN
jgi:hypothetical protein